MPSSITLQNIRDWLGMFHENILIKTEKLQLIKYSFLKSIQYSDTVHIKYLSICQSFLVGSELNDSVKSLGYWLIAWWRVSDQPYFSSLLVGCHAVTVLWMVSSVILHNSTIEVIVRIKQKEKLYCLHWIGYFGLISLK